MSSLDLRFVPAFLVLIPKPKPPSLTPRAKSQGAGSSARPRLHLSQMTIRAMGRAASPKSLALVLI